MFFHSTAGYAPNRVTGIAIRMPVPTPRERFAAGRTEDTLKFCKETIGLVIHRRYNF